MRKFFLAAACFIGQLSYAYEALPTYRVTNAQIQSVAQKWEIIGRVGQDFEVAVPPQTAKEFAKLAPNATLIRDLHADLAHYDKIKGAKGFQSTEQRLQEIAQQYPNIAKLETYGTSTQGRPEYVLTLATDVANIDMNKPGILITSATHGDEVITVDVVMGLINQLVNGYNKDTRLTQMIDTHTLYFMPMLCVDSYVARTRSNDGQDPNRSYPYPNNAAGHPTRAIKDEMNWVANHPNLKGSIDFHAAASMIMFPWAYTYARIPAQDYNELDELTGYMAEANGFVHGPIAETIYVAPGSSADYWYWKYKVRALGVEVSHNLAAKSLKEINDIVTENTESTWRFIEHF